LSVNPSGLLQFYSVMRGGAAVHRKHVVNSAPWNLVHTVKYWCRNVPLVFGAYASSDVSQSPRESRSDYPLEQLVHGKDQDASISPTGSPLPETGPSNDDSSASKRLRSATVTYPLLPWVSDVLFRFK